MKIEQGNFNLKKADLRASILVELADEADIRIYIVEVRVKRIYGCSWSALQNIALRSMYYVFIISISGKNFATV